MHGMIVESRASRGRNNAESGMDNTNDRLARWLQDEMKKRNLGVRGLGELTDVSHSVIARLAKSEAAPELETLAKLASGLGRPLADVVEMAGFSLGLPAQDAALVARLAAQAQGDPLTEEILVLLQHASHENRRAVLAYLRGARQDDQ